VPHSDGLSSVQMRVKCPKCGQAMLVEVGLAPETDNLIQCVRCGVSMDPLVPGPVIGKPVRAED